MRVKTAEGVYEYPEGTFPPGIAPAGTPAPKKNAAKPRLVEKAEEETKEAQASTVETKARTAPRNKSRTTADTK